MSHVALYRKYRSQTFGDLVGQDHVVRTLQNSLSSGKFAQAFLFTGPRGTGKTSTARLLAKALNCESGPKAEPCNTCEHCTSITRGNCMDVVEMDAASESGVEQVRQNIVDTVDYRPVSCRYRIFIIDEVHDLSAKAFDALLKTIEEPPPHIVFILATTEYHQVPATIRSRCQRYDFQRATILQLVDRLKHVVAAEGIEADSTALNALARMADGGFRDALTLLEQVVLTSDGKLTLDQVVQQLGLISDDRVDALLTAIKDKDPGAVLTQLDEVFQSGRDTKSILESVAMRLSELTRAMYGVEQGAGQDAATEANLHATGTRLGVDFLTAMRVRTADCLRAIREVSLPRLWLESHMVNLAVGGVPVTPPAVQAAPPAPAPTRAKAAPAAPTPSPTPARPPVVVAPEPETPAKSTPLSAVVEPTDDPELARARKAWQEVVVVLSASPTARIRLEQSRLSQIGENRATIEFSREMDAEWLRDKPKLNRAVNEEWAKRMGDGVQLEFTSAPKNGAKSQDLDVPAVELPMEGTKLDQVGREVFDGF